MSLLLFCFVAGCVTEEPARYLEFGCEDIAVVGRIKTLNQTAIQGSDPLSDWQSAYQLQIHIKRVVRGSERRRLVLATAIAHAQIRDDRDFLIVLTPDGAGGYSVAAASLWQYRPKLSASCLPASGIR
ncbi:hypothetical protein [Pelagerythrobacter aerophilus]|uniref:Uncharacterized protein n=1 Tax=Pelagerythrobacter aerophilus TaxID=2306995 RepID=A0A418NHU0_9SPHN|nr:hypothetical protein [Pelagerythrobacter aerophilus]RIV78221.1 hypothetical protein D2V04_10185 [Pelagerythrobacter aerophilus]